MVARFAEPKNQTELLEAVAGCRPPFRLTFIGDGPTKPAVEQAVDRLNLRDQVEFLGTRKDVDEKLAESSILALATRREGLPISVLEGMRAGLPVIATEVGGVRETVCHNTTGFLYREGDVESLRRNLDTLLQSPDLRTRLGAALPARVTKLILRVPRCYRRHRRFMPTFWRPPNLPLHREPL